MKKPYIIAEMSGNHNQEIENAKKLILAAKEAGADAVKLQTYTADTITLNCEGDGFVIKNKDSLWAGRKLYDLYEEAHTPWDWHEDLFNYAKEIGIEIFSSPFDETAVDLLEKLNAPIYKVASFEVTDINLVEYIGKTKKPVILSTGIATLSEINEAVTCLKDCGVKDITLLHCVSSYPAPVSETRLQSMQFLKDTFDVKVGLSDHSLGIGVSVAAAALGAEVIEKHFCLDRSKGGVDSAFSLEPHELKSLVEETKVAFEAAQGKKIRYSENEDSNKRVYSRSLYIAKDVKKGDRVTKENVRSVRPGLGMHPRHLKTVLEGHFNNDYKMGTPMSFDKIFNT